MSKTKKLLSREKMALELFHQRFSHRSTRLLLYGDIESFWEDIKPRIGPYPFFTSCQISAMNKNAGSKNPLNPKASFE